MIDTAQLPPRAFGKADPTPDSDFYRQPRFVLHIDDRAVAAVTGLYRELFAPGDTLLDLMSSWVSHLPEEVRYAAVVGLGLNAAELAANPRLSGRFVQDLNAEPTLPLETASFDGAALCVSVQYLQSPVAVLREVARVLRPEAPLAITFSNRCFPTKAVAIWTALPPGAHAGLVAAYLHEAGFAAVETRELLPGSGGDPLWAVLGRAPAQLIPSACM